jgi:hypothetical protein
MLLEQSEGSGFGTLVTLPAVPSLPTLLYQQLSELLGSTGGGGLAAWVPFWSHQKSARPVAASLPFGMTVPFGVRPITLP